MNPNKTYIEFEWDDTNRTKGFSAWEEEISHVESQGYKLVPANYHIPHWSHADNAPKLYVNGRDGVSELKVAFDRPAGDLGYPIFFKNQ